MCERETEQEEQEQEEGEREQERESSDIVQSMKVYTENEDKWNEVRNNEDAYYQFVIRFIEHTTSRTSMLKMTDRKGGKEYSEVVSVCDESFAMMILEDRLRLWMEVVKRRNERDLKENESVIQFRRRELKKTEEKNGVTIEKNIEGVLRDSKGKGYTLYSAGGLKDPKVVKGYNNYGVKRINALQKDIEIWRESDQGKEMMKNIKSRWVKEVEGKKVGKGGTKRLYSEITEGMNGTCAIREEYKPCFK